MTHGDTPDSSSGVGGVDYEQVSNFAHRSAVFPQSVPEIPARVSVSAALNRSASIAGVPIVRNLRGVSYASFPRGTGGRTFARRIRGMEQSVGIGVGRSFRRATAHCWNASLFACCRLLPLAVVARVAWQMPAFRPRVPSRRRLPRLPSPLLPPLVSGLLYLGPIPG